MIYSKQLILLTEKLSKTKKLSPDNFYNPHQLLLECLLQIMHALSENLFQIWFVNYDFFEFIKKSVQFVTLQTKLTYAVGENIKWSEKELLNTN